MIKLYTAKEVSEILQFNYRKVLDLIVMGEIPCYRIGHQYRISDTQISKYLTSSKYKPPFNLRRK